MRITKLIGNRFHRFADLSPEVENALLALAVQSEWPLDLYRILIDQIPRHRRAILLCTRNNDVAGVIALVKDARGTWEPVTQWILPGWLGPVVPALLSPITSTIPVRTRFAWWRMAETAPPRGGNVRTVNMLPTYAMRTSSNFEAYWKSTGQLRSIQKARTRCASMQFAVNQAGAAQWVITRSDERWRTEPRRPTDQMGRRIVTAAYLESLGLHFTLTLQDGDRWIAGDTYLVHRGDLVALCTYRDRDYDHCGAGNRLLDLAFHWAREMRFNSVDIGGGYAYKERWAPEGGTRGTVLVSPQLSYIGYQASKLASSWSSIVKARVGRVLHLARAGKL